MPVTVQFSVRAGRDLFLTEPGADVAPLAGQDYLYGRVLLSVPGGPDVFVEDELVPLVADLCFQAPAQLGAGESFGAYINRYPGEYYVEPAGTDLRLHGSAVLATDGHRETELVAPAAELLPALHDCGRRALAFIRGQLGQDPAQADALNALDALQAETSAALRR